MILFWVLKETPFPSIETFVGNNIEKIRLGSTYMITRIRAVLQVKNTFYPAPLNGVCGFYINFPKSKPT